MATALFVVFGLFAVLVLVGLVQDVAYFLLGHESLTGDIVKRRRAIHVPCKSILIREHVATDDGLKRRETIYGADR